MQLIDRLGFHAVDAGLLEAGLALEPDGPAFGIAYNADELVAAERTAMDLVYATRSADGFMER